MSKSNGINRREFLRLAGLGTAAAVVAGGVAGCSANSDEGTQPGGGIKFTKQTDALIIGTGGAGLWAAYELIKAGVKPLILEKQPSWGGDTILACGVMPIRGTKAQAQQGIQDQSPEQSWQASKDALSKRYRVPELIRLTIVNAVRCVDIWTEEFKVQWTAFDKNAYTKFFHIPAPGMQNDHKLLEPLVNFAKSNGAEFIFETMAISLIVNQKNEVVGVRTQDQVTGKYMDIRAKKVLLATGDWVSHQEMVARYLPKWEGLPMTTYTSMGDGVRMAQAIGAAVTRMEEPSNLMSHFAPTVVWGYYNTMIHVLPNAKRVNNENALHEVADKVHEAGYEDWWTICDDELVNGVHANTFKTREKAGGVVKANTIEELAEKTYLPLAQLKATIEKYNTDAKAGKDTEFGKTTAFVALKPPYYAVPSRVVRYKTNGGLSMNDKCQVVDKAGTPIANLYAAGSCQGETTPNVHDVCAIGMHAGQQIAAALGKGKTPT